VKAGKRGKGKARVSGGRESDARDSKPCMGKGKEKESSSDSPFYFIII